MNSTHAEKQSEVPLESVGCGEPPAQHDVSPPDLSTAADAPAPTDDAVSFMRRFIAHAGLCVGGNEKLYPRAESSTLSTMEGKRARYRAAPIAVRRLISRAHEFCVLHRLPFKRADLFRGYDLAVESLAGARRVEIWEPISPISLSADERDRAEEQFSKFATLIDAPARIAIYSLKHWMWMTKRKGGVNEEIGDHLMLIFLNAIQGSGKTEFVKKLLAPLAELATAPVNITQVSHELSAELYSNAVLNVDDLGYLPESKVSPLKALMTSDYQLRRVPRTSGTEHIRQRASLIGTSNKPVGELIRDETGHRRFVMLPLRNGCVERGGSAEVWKTINELDFPLMWRSVCETTARGPIKEILDELVSYQAQWMPIDPLLCWLRKIDRSEYRIRHISAPQGGVEARDLWELFEADTGSDMSEKSFSRAMMRLLNDPTVPFRKKTRTAAGYLYQWKTVDHPPRSSSPTATSKAPSESPPA